MVEEITELKSPIDALYLIHKALRTEAHRAQSLVEQLDTGGSLQPFKLVFNAWATALVYHAELEDTYIMAPLISLPSSEDGGPEGTEGRAGSEAPQTAKPSRMTASMKATMIAQEEEMHRELVETVQDVLTVLNEEIGKTSIITRTKQHLHRQVVALRIAQEDHLETEEALVLPLLRETMSEQQQLEAIQALLIDKEAQDPRWIIEWVTRGLAQGEQQLLTDLESRFAELPDSLGLVCLAGGRRVRVSALKCTTETIRHV